MIHGSITIGPFTIPFIIILLVLATAAAHLLMSVLLRKDLSRLKKSPDHFFNLFLIFFFTWRISLILTNWQTVKTTITALLYLPGGRGNYLIAAGVTAACVLWSALAKRKSPQDLLDLLKLLSLTALLFILITAVASGTEAFDSGYKTDIEVQPAERPEEVSILLTDISGRESPLKLSDKDVTIINFWATWCPPCRAEIPEINRFYEDYRDGNIRLIGINLTTTEPSVSHIREFIEKENVNFTVLLDSRGEASDKFNIESIPTTLVFNTKGDLIDYRIGAVDYAWLAGVIPEE